MFFFVFITAKRSDKYLNMSKDSSSKKKKESRSRKRKNKKEKHYTDSESEGKNYNYHSIKNHLLYLGAWLIYASGSSTTQIIFGHFCTLIQSMKLRAARYSW